MLGLNQRVSTVAENQDLQTRSVVYWFSLSFRNVKRYAISSAGSLWIGEMMMLVDMLEFWIGDASELSTSGPIRDPRLLCVSEEPKLGDADMFWSMMSTAKTCEMIVKTVVLEVNVKEVKFFSFIFLFD
jgi:hypothetical protein